VFEELEVNVYGLSLDDVADMGKFHKAQNLNFKLLSDPDGSVATKFGALAKGGRFANRYTYVIDPEGVLRYIEKSVDVAKHGENLLDKIVDLQD
jgi:peroxiredoxin Q/BCP